MATAPAGTIVVGYDDSVGSRAALDHAVGLARRAGFDVTVVFCYEPPATRAGGAVDQRDLLESIGRELLESAQQQVAGTDVVVTGELVDGRPVEGLIAAADEHEAVMIVVGHHGEGPLRGALLGATANKLLHLAERPVLVVPATDSGD
jgi:nucleotide-binding universal stress UspA family protein